jgi:thioredoxin 1
MGDDIKVRDVTDSNFQEEVLQAEMPTLVDFWATWCIPCKAVNSILEELAGQYEDKVKITKLNVDDSPRTCTKYGVRSIPTLILFKEGRVVGQEIGAVPKGRVESLINKALAAGP